MCSEKTKHLWYKYYGLFVRMYITSQQSYLSQINTRQTSFEAYFDSKRKSRDVFYCAERHLKKLFTVIITGKLTNSSWHLYRKCFVVSLDADTSTGTFLTTGKNISATTSFHCTNIYQVWVKWTTTNYLNKTLYLIYVVKHIWFDLLIKLYLL